MARIFIQYFAIYNNENLPNCILNLPKLAQNNAKFTWTLSKWPKLYNGVPKWRNFAQSGHTTEKAEEDVKLPWEWCIKSKMWFESSGIPPVVAISKGQTIFFKKCAITGLFLFIFVLSTNKQYSFYNKSMWKNVEKVFNRPNLFCWRIPTVPFRLNIALL